MKAFHCNALNWLLLT